MLNTVKEVTDGDTGLAILWNNTRVRSVAVKDLDIGVCLGAAVGDKKLPIQ